MSVKHRAVFACLGVVLMFALLMCGASESMAVYKQPTAIATFESIGISWEPEDYPDVEDTVTVQYRNTSSGGWLDAMPLWYDERDGSYPRYPLSEDRYEYRGSIVGLDPGEQYVVKLTHPDVTDSVTISTWDETFPIWSDSTVYLPWHSDETLVISEGGNSVDGYRLYTFDPDIGRATIDCYDYDNSDNMVDSCCVRIQASYVILKGLTLHGGQNGVLIEDPDDTGITNVVVEECDISMWGVLDANDGTTVHPASDEIGQNLDGAVRFGHGSIADSISSRSKRFIIQRNRIHDPRWKTCYWYQFEYPRHHPYGPSGIVLCNTGGNHVIRYNEIYSSDNYFLDGLTGGENFSHYGFPGPDSDLYGNSINRVWDDAIEVEGGNANVRVWGNFTNHVYTSFGCAPVSTGPVYIFRNVTGLSHRDPTHAPEDSGEFVKVQNAAPAENIGDGGLFIYHNTILQPTSSGPAQLNGYGHKGGIVNSDSNYGAVRNIVARNNIIMTPAGDTRSFRTVGADTLLAPGSLTNVYSHDVYNGVAVGGDSDYVVAGTMRFGVADLTGAYNPFGQGYAICTSGSFCPALADTMARDYGLSLPNFNDGYNGSGPDIGAHEYGDANMEFGVGAYISPDPDIPEFGDSFEILLRNGYVDYSDPDSDYAGGDEALVSTVCPTYCAGGDAQAPVKATLGTAGSYQMLFRFDIADLGIPGNATLEDATFSFNDNTGSASTMAYEIYPMEHDWVEDYVCWSQYDDGIAWRILSEISGTSISSFSGTTGGGSPTEMDVTDLVADWLATPAEADYGFLLEEQNGTMRIIYQGETALASKRPSLTLTVSLADTLVSRRALPADPQQHWAEFSRNGGDASPRFTSGLQGNYPNPFNPDTKISFTVGSDKTGGADVALEIFDTAGRRVAVLQRGQLAAGEYTYTWRGRNSAGVQVGSGVYFSRLVIDDQVFNQKMIMLK